MFSVQTTFHFENCWVRVRLFHYIRHINHYMVIIHIEVVSSRFTVCCSCDYSAEEMCFLSNVFTSCKQFWSKSHQHTSPFQPHCAASALRTALCWCTSYLLQVRRQPLVQLLQSHFLSGQTEAPAAVRSRTTRGRTRAVPHRTCSSMVDAVSSRCTRCSPRMKNLPRRHHSLIFPCIASRIIRPPSRAQLLQS